MNYIRRYSGIASIAISLIMLSLGSIPHTFGGPVISPNEIPSSIQVNISCGINISGSADFGLVSFGETKFNSDVTLSNSGTGTGQISANVGTSLLSSPQAGGYAGTTDETTHIAPRDITLQIDSQGRVPMSDFGSDVQLGVLANTDPGVLEVGVSINPINLPTSDPTWVANFFLTISDCQFVK